MKLDSNYERKHIYILGISQDKIDCNKLWYEIGYKFEEDLQFSQHSLKCRLGAMRGKREKKEKREPIGIVEGERPYKEEDILDILENYVQ